MKCKKCGNELRESDKFCPNCGKSVNGAKKNRYLFISIIVLVCLALAFLGYQSMQYMASSDNLKNVKITFSGKSGEGRAYIKESEFKKYGLDKLIDEDDLEYSIKPNKHLSNGDEVVLEIEDDGIFGDDHKYKYIVKGLSDDGKLEIKESVNSNKIITEIKRKGNIDKLEKIAMKKIDKQYNNYKIEKINTFLCKEDDHDDFALYITYEIEQKDKKQYIAVEIEDIIENGHFSLKDAEVEQLIEKDDITDINDYIKNHYSNVYLV